MTRRQRGVTTIGWIFLLVPVALVFYAGIRVGPEYLNYYKVVTALKETASKLKSDETLYAADHPRSRSIGASTPATSITSEAD